MSGYRWRDGVGPVEDRPRRAELAWASDRAEHVRDQRVHRRSAGRSGTEPYLVVNCGDGDLREARDWVEYCNGTTDTALVRLRAAHGHPEPHRVRYWGIGNEVDGAWQIGAKTAAEYARAYHEFAKVMRWTDPSIKLIASATSDWDGDIVERAQLLVEEAADLIDYVSIHWYVGDKAGDSAAYLATSELIEERLHAYRGPDARPDPGARGRAAAPIPLAVDEWNVWYRATGGPTEPSDRPLEEVYDLQDALVVAMHLNAFVRHAATVRMANLAQLVNVIAPIVTRPDGIAAPDDLPSIRAVPAHDRLRRARRVVGRRHVQRWSPTRASGRSTSRRRSIRTRAALSVHVVNRHETDALDVAIELAGGSFAGAVEINTITGPDLKVTNTFEEPDARHDGAVAGSRSTLPTRSPPPCQPRSVTGLVFTL